MVPLGTKLAATTNICVDINTALVEPTTTDRSRVKRLDLNAGDLQFFLGRFSLHQVTENTGIDDRLLLIMSFTQKPGVIGNRIRVKDLYGKTSVQHDDDQSVLVRSDNLMD